MIIAPDYDVDALEILGQKKNRIILVRKKKPNCLEKQFRALLNGVLVQDKDMNIETVADLRTVTDKAPTRKKWKICCLPTRSLRTVNQTLSCWQKANSFLQAVWIDFTVDALKQAIEKPNHSGFDLNGAASGFQMLSSPSRIA